MIVIANRYIANMSIKNSGCALPVGVLIGGVLGIVIPVTLLDVSQGMTGIFVFMALVIFGGVGAVIGGVLGLIIAFIGAQLSARGHTKEAKKTNRTTNIIVIITIFLIVVLMVRLVWLGVS